MPQATWEPQTKHGDLDTAEKNDLPESVFAFPKKRKPLTDAEHARNAARFDQVKGVSDAERDEVFANIQKAARHYKGRDRRGQLARSGQANAYEEPGAVSRMRTIEQRKPAGRAPSGWFVVRGLPGCGSVGQGVGGDDLGVPAGAVFEAAGEGSAVT